MSKKRKRRKKEKYVFLKFFFGTLAFGLVILWVWYMTVMQKQNHISTPLVQNQSSSEVLAAESDAVETSGDGNYISLGKFLDTSLIAVGERRFYYLYETPSLYAFFRSDDPDTLYKVSKDQSELNEREGDPVVEISSDGNGQKFIFYVSRKDIQTIYHDEDLDEFVNAAKKYRKFN